MEVPRVFQLGMLLFVLLTGTMPQVLQATFYGLTGGETGFAVAIIAKLVYDLLLVAPLIVLARHPSGILHPIIIAVVLWPVLTSLPNLIDNFGGYSGLLSGQPLAPPFYRALAWRDAETAWLDTAKYNMLQVLSLLSLYAGFALAPPRRAPKLQFLAELDTRRLRTILISIILVNFVAVAVFIQLRGGLIEHIADLSYGRFRALAGFGPILALFDIGFLSLVLWICYRPQDARNPWFVILLPAVAAQEFVVAGSRSSALLVFVLVGLGWTLAARKIPWRLGLILLPVAFLSFGALNIIRTAGLTNTTAVEAVQNSDLQDVLDRSQKEFDIRQSVSGTVPVVADAMRTTGPMWGYTYVGAVFAMVPRAIWEDKPRGPGSLYAQYFLGETEEGAAVPIGPVSEAFWNFHIPGVIVLFLLYGALLRLAYDIYSANSRNGFVVTSFLLFATTFGVSTDQLVAIQQTVITVGLLLVIVFLTYPSAFRGARGRSGQPAAVQPAAPGRA
jgi:hypothetical protein